MQEQVLTPSADNMLAHLKALFSDIPDYDDGRVEIAWANAEGKPHSAETFPIIELEKAAACALDKNRKGHSVYLSGAILDPEAAFFSRSSDADFYAASWVWADIDDKTDPEWLKQAYAHCKPSLGIVTAKHPHRRIQLWWRLSEPATDSDDVREALQGICGALKGDPMVTNPTSLMRLGGGVNYPSPKKMAKGRINENTEFHRLEEHRYHIDEIKRAFPVQNYAPDAKIFEPPPYTAANSNGLNMGAEVRTDGRERYASRMVYASIIHLAEEIGSWPSLQQVFDDVWPAYSRHVKSLATGGLEKEGRGQKMILEKIRNKLGLFQAGRMPGKPTPESLHAAWKAKQQANAGAKEGAKTPPPGMDPDTGEIPMLRATSIDDLDLDNIPAREFLYEKFIGRKYVTMIVAPPGAGKSMFTMQMAVSAATEKAWGPWEAKQKNLNVWIYNNEEGEEELRRRLKAIMIANDLKKNDFKARFFIDSGERRAINIAKLGDDGVIALPDYELLKAEVIARKIDILIIDPFAETHSVSENSNDEIKRVMGFYRQLAFDTNCAVILIHHARKGVSEQAGESDISRGGGAQIGVVRRMFTLMAMSEKEAEKLGVPPERRKWFVRFDDAKTNITAPADGATWLRLKSIPLMNGRGLNPQGDEVGILEHVSPEEITAEFTGAMNDRSQKILMALYETMSPTGMEKVFLKDIMDIFKIVPGLTSNVRRLRDMVKNAIETQHPSVPFIANGEANYFTIRQTEGAKQNAYVIYRRSEMI